jgi:transcriptional regulator with XRE-family HTH domain
VADEDRIGARVAAIRKLRGWTARELARKASVSYSLLTKVESGAAPASPAFIGAVARALRVDVPRITGQPYSEPRGRYAALQAGIVPLRRVLLAYDVPSALDAPVRPVAELQADVRAASLLGREARYVQLAARLPVLLEELQAAVWRAGEADRPQLYALLAEAYGGASGIAHQLGYLDLRALVLDRIEWASRQSGDPLRVARTQWSRGVSFLGAAAYEQGLTLMERTRADLGRDVGRMDEAARSVYGSLHLRSAVLAARAGRRADADAHLGEARAISGAVPEGANHYGMEFGPANVGLHEVSAAVELADGTLAVTRAERFERTGRLRALPAVRVGQYRLDVARGWLYHGDTRRALRSLQAGRRAAPQLIRVHPMARETVRVIARTETRPSEDLRSFAAWLGIES